jgi:hypothetical protein
MTENKKTPTREQIDKALYSYTAGSSVHEEEHFIQGYRAGYDALAAENEELRAERDSAFQAAYKEVSEKMSEPLGQLRSELRETSEAYWKEITEKDLGMQQLSLSNISLREKLGVARAELERMRSCCYHSLLEATAWMGIPEKKRESFIKAQMSNANFIVDEALAKLEGSTSVDSVSSTEDTGGGE